LEQHWLFDEQVCPGTKQDAACADVGTAMDVTSGSAAIPSLLINSRRDTLFVPGISGAGSASR